MHHSMPMGADDMDMGPMNLNDRDRSQMKSPPASPANGPMRGCMHHSMPMDADDMDMGPMNLNDRDRSQMKSPPASPASGPMMGGMHGHHGGHAHDSWVEAPATYSGYRFEQWDNYNRAAEGMALYRDNCMQCHGLDGSGSGPLAEKLKHPPADLTNHFHLADGQGDAYLFWRVSKGGVVEPFAAADSAMPAFKERLSEAQRWNVLTYIHQAFHRGFKSERAQGMQPSPTGGHGGAHH